MVVENKEKTGNGGSMQLILGWTQKFHPSYLLNNCVHIMASVCEITKPCCVVMCNVR